MGENSIRRYDPKLLPFRQNGELGRMISLFCTRISDFASPEHPLVPGQLSPAEQSEYARINIPKRRGEWAAGRLALKALVRSVLPELNLLKWGDIEICKEASGAPYLTLRGEPLACRVSLSHSNGYVFVACSSNVLRLGVDLEKIEPRAPEFLADYFTPGEIRQAQVDELQRDWITTLFWSAKEALLKAASIGLAVDPRRIDLTLRSAPGDAGWQVLGVECADVLQPAPCLVWRREGGMILTVCWQGAADQRLIRIHPNQD